MLFINKLIKQTAVKTLAYSANRR